MRVRRCESELEIYWNLKEIVVFVVIPTRQSATNLDTCSKYVSLRAYASSAHMDMDTGTIAAIFVMQEYESSCHPHPDQHIFDSLANTD